jgi:hypothetical protein
VYAKVFQDFGCGLYLFRHFTKQIPSPSLPNIFHRGQDSGLNFTLRFFLYK